MAPPPPTNDPSNSVEDTFSEAPLDTQDEANRALAREIANLKQQIREERLIAILTCATLINVIFFTFLEGFAPVALAGFQFLVFFVVAKRVGFRELYRLLQRLTGFVGRKNPGDKDHPHREI